jgi:hypothetical protein
MAAAGAPRRLRIGHATATAQTDRVGESMTELFRDDQKPLFAGNYNRACFMFDHALHHNPIFDLDNIATLTARLPVDAVYCSVGVADVGGGWNQGQDPKRHVPDIVRGIANADALVMLKSVDRDPEFGPVFRQVVAELATQVGDHLIEDLDLGRATLLVSSPHRVTAYHIDAEVNYLMQIRGEKQFFVFDGRDRTLVTDVELEAFYAGDFNAARYRHDRQDAATEFNMVPGKGAHVPVNAPHWVRNGDSVSVSLSVNYDLRSNKQVGTVYRVNHRLRRVGLSPMAPGVSPWRDRLKVAAFDGAARARRLSRTLRP